MLSSMVDVNKIIVSALKTGKVLFGAKQALNAAKSGKAVLFIVASNCPKYIFHELQSYSSKIPLYVSQMSNSDLGNICKKPFPISTLTIREVKEPEILKQIQELKIESSDELKQS